MGYTFRFCKPKEHTNSQEKSNSVSPIALALPVRETETKLSSKMKKYYHDPMRINKNPDVVGQFYDPMGGRSTYSRGVDPTDTGA
ncbi:hypothetical protein BDF14DRAFT_1779869 [Spinellus fusiger]|nr:hypothetical protein BDF14DRAFT_1779869 [Spinellus fusiger]